MRIPWVLDSEWQWPSFIIKPMEPELKIQRLYELPYKLEMWEQVRPELMGIAECKFTVKELRRKLQYFNSLSTFRSNPPDLDSLFSLPSSSIIPLYSLLSKFILHCESSPPVIPLFRQGHPLCHTFPRKTVVLLLALMACLLTPSQQLQTYATKHNFSREWNFAYIFSYDSEKMQSVLAYLSKELGREEITGSLQLVRRMERVLALEEVTKSEAQLVKVQMLIGKESIEQFPHTLKVDFANKFIGGGALDYGNAQEEIMFLCHPEMFISMLLCEKVKENQVIAFKGFKKLYKISGYMEDLEFQSEETEIKYEQDENGIASDYIVAIDALKNPDPQYSPAIIMRELNKAYIGFTAFPQTQEIATGNWGCGVFGGDPQLKFIIQWLSASLAKKSLIYCAYSHKTMLEAGQLIDKVKGLKVGELMEVLLGFEGQRKDGRRSVFDFMLKLL